MSELRIEIVFALPERQCLRAFTVPLDTTVGAAISESGLPEEFPGFDFGRATVGVWGSETERGRVLRDGDRVEIYRPLELDPREARRRFALAGRTMNVGENADQD